MYYFVCWYIGTDVLLMFLFLKPFLNIYLNKILIEYQFFQVEFYPIEIFSVLYTYAYKIDSVKKTKALKSRADKIPICRDYISNRVYLQI